MSENSDVFVYVIAARDGAEITAPVKIGISSNPRVRLEGFQTACPFELAIVRQFRFPTREIARGVEDCFHQTQAKHHIRGEWFSLAPNAAILTLELHIRFHLECFSDLNQTEKEIALEHIGCEVAI